MEWRRSAQRRAPQKGQGVICHAYRGLDVCHVMHVMTRSKVTVLGQSARYFTRSPISSGVRILWRVQCHYGSKAWRLDPNLEHGINVDDSDNGSKHYPEQSSRM
jgi:hypothetical protein